MPHGAPFLSTPGNNAVVVRLVYDGPPRSGKTTSLRALAGAADLPETLEARA